MSAPSNTICISQTFAGCALSLICVAAPGEELRGNLYMHGPEGRSGTLILMADSGAFPDAAEWIEARFPVEAHALAYAALSHFEDVARILAMQGAA